MQQLLDLLRGVSPLSPALEERLHETLTHKHHKKGEILLREGEVSKRIFYIEKGLVRSYHILDGEEVTNWFMKEGDICISVVSFFGQLPSTDYIVADSDCDVWGISYQQLEDLFAQCPEFNRHGRLISNRYYVLSEQRHQMIKRQKKKIGMPLL